MPHVDGPDAKNPRVEGPSAEGPVTVTPPSTQADRAWLEQLWTAEWCGTTMISRGKRHRLDELEARIAWQGGERVGAVDAAQDAKPTIPRVGDHGIPIHDEIELEKAL